MESEAGSKFLIRRVFFTRTGSRPRVRPRTCFVRKRYSNLMIPAGSGSEARLGSLQRNRSQRLNRPRRPRQSISNGKPSAPSAGLTLGYVLGGALSVAITAFVLHALKLQHPPAGATTLIVSLGVIATPVGILSMAAAIAFTIIVGWGVNWALRERPKETVR